MEPFQVGVYALIAVLVLLANRVPIAAALGVVASIDRGIPDRGLPRSTPVVGEGKRNGETGF